MTTISVIAGGWSFAEVDHNKVPGEVIGVNDALVFWLGARPLDAIVSMDRLWTEHRWRWIEKAQIQTYLRRSTLQNVPWKKHPWDWLHTYECHTDLPSLSPTERTLNGRNSGACAINLAYTKRPSHLYLFGFDMCLSPKGHAHWHPPYPWSKGVQGNTGTRSYGNWAGDFWQYKKQFEAIGTTVYNVSPSSQIHAFKKVSPQEVGCAR